MGILNDSSMMPKKSPVAPTLKEIGLEMSIHASALSEALALPLVDPDRFPSTVALRFTSRPASRSTKTLTELLNALTPRASCHKVNNTDMEPLGNIIPEE